jgi:hypothetical protein
MHLSTRSLRGLSTTALLAASLLVAPSGSARVSLATIDAKLDAILAALDGGAAPAAVEAVSVTESRLVDDEGNALSHEVFEVPAGKLLVVDYASILMDVVVQNRPASEIRIRGEIHGRNPADSASSTSVPLGFMEEYARTSRGTPNFLIAKEVTAYFGAGPVTCFADTRFGGTSLDFGAVTCTLTGRLVDAPVP